MADRNFREGYGFDSTKLKQVESAKDGRLITQHCIHILIRVHVCITMTLRGTAGQHSRMIDSIAGMSA